MALLPLGFISRFTVCGQLFLHIPASFTLFARLFPLHGPCVEDLTAREQAETAEAVRITENNARKVSHPWAIP